MKYFLLIALALLVGNAVSEVVIDKVLEDAKKKIGEAVDGSRKRQEKTEADICAEACSPGGEDDVEDKFDVASREELDKVCEEGKAGQQCLDACGDYQHKEVADAAFRIFDFMCKDHYEDFIAQLPCIEKLDKEEETAECEAECEPEPAAEPKAEREAEGEAEGEEEPEVVIEDMNCATLSCELQCGAKKIQEVCGDNKFGDLIVGLVKTSMEVGKFITEHFGGEFPADCTAFLDEGADNAITE